MKKATFYVGDQKLVNDTIETGERNEEVASRAASKWKVCSGKGIVRIM